MSINKYVITRLYNEKKTITYEQPLLKEKDGGMYMNFTESIITQMVKARDEDEFKSICGRIQDFIEKEGIDVCFAINQNELLDCLNEHQRLKLQIQDLEHRLSNCIEPKFKIGQEVWVNDWTGQLRSGEIFEIQTNQVKFDQVPLITYLVDYYGAYSDDDQENDYFEEKDVFLTEEEAKAKLREIQDGR